MSKESRYRNLSGSQMYRRGSRVPPGWLILVVTSVLLVCCACVGLVVGFQLRGGSLPKSLSLPNPLASTPQATATPNLKAEVPLKGKGLNENGLELTVTSFQRPLQVQGMTKVPADQEFVLISVSLQNNKTSGQPIATSPVNFRVIGDGGLSYDANPPTVTIENMLTARDTVGPGKTLERELIFQVAKDDSGLKLYWTVGKTTRIFVLEPDR
ncbi:MAG: DUF4352 domain-containing protein [Chloroflexi bacterium]|nr:DUF4352 domain-containing protein [Chloroflexota bacterium]